LPEPSPSRIATQINSRPSRHAGCLFASGEYLIPIGRRKSESSRDYAGYLVTGPSLSANGPLPGNWPLDRHPYYLETSAPGVFAVGNVRHGSVKRYASAVGEGAMAVTFVHRYLSAG
jgi:hypothetical protein